MRRVLSLVGVLGMVLGLTIPAGAGVSELTTICHATPVGWRVLKVPPRAADAHLAHGDGLADGPVPGSPVSAVFTDECEVLYAVAYTDVDPSDGGYKSGVDALISKLVEGPPPADDGVPGVGDLVVLNVYPLDFEAASFGEWTRTTHVIPDGGRVGIEVEPVLCGPWWDDPIPGDGVAGGATFFWALVVDSPDPEDDFGDKFQISSSKKTGPNVTHQHRASLFDSFTNTNNPHDFLRVDLGEPGFASVAIPPTAHPREAGDDPFLDVDLHCMP